jgi:hypothetical protein
MTSGPEEAAASWLRAQLAVSSVYRAPTLGHRQLSCVMYFDDPERGLKVMTVISADVGDVGARAAILLRILLKKRSEDPTHDYFSGVSKIYEFEYASNANSDDLVIVLSACHKIQNTVNNANKNVLYIADTSETYFFRHIYRLVAAIDTFVAESNFKRVLFFGGSKAGFSAILLAAQFARSAPHRMVHCLAFSPHTRLFPRNKSLNIFTSYIRFQARAKQHPALAALLKKFGNLKPALTLPNLFMTIVFCERHRVDAAEAAYLAHPNVTFVPLPSPVPHERAPVPDQRAEAGPSRKDVQDSLREARTARSRRARRDAGRHRGVLQGGGCGRLDPAAPRDGRTLPELAGRDDRPSRGRRVILGPWRNPRSAAAVATRPHLAFR